MDAQLTAALVRSVSKTGGFGLELDHARDLAAVITEQEAVELYAAIRDQAHRDEREWRTEFEELFPNCVAALPPLSKLPFEPQKLFELIELSTYPDLPDEYFDAFEDFLGQADEAEMDLSGVTKDSLTLREYAMHRGKLNLLELLDEYGVQ